MMTTTYDVVIGGDYTHDDLFGYYLGRDAPGLVMPKCPDCGGQITDDLAAPACPECGSLFEVSRTGKLLWLRRRRFTG